MPAATAAIVEDAATVALVVVAASTASVTSMPHSLDANVA